MRSGVIQVCEEAINKVWSRMRLGECPGKAKGVAGIVLGGAI